MTNPNSSAIRYRKYPSALAARKNLCLKRRSYRWMGASVLFSGAAAVTAKVILTASLLPSPSHLLPAVQNTSLILTIVSSLILAAIWKKADSMPARLLMLTDSAAAGIFLGCLGVLTPMPWFVFWICNIVIFIGSFLFLVFKAKYEPENLEPLILTSRCPGLYRFRRSHKKAVRPAAFKA